jgi:hypothetical protein
VPAPAPLAPALPTFITALIEPSLGGTLTLTLTLPSGTLTILVPIDAYADALTVTLGPAQSTPGGENGGNLIVGGRAYVLLLSDSTGAPVTAFDQPLMLIYTPSADEVAVAEGDLSGIGAAVYNAESGEYDALVTLVTDEGTVTAAFASVGIVLSTPDRVDE